MTRVWVCAAVIFIATTSQAQEYLRSVVVPPIATAAPGISPHGITGLNFGKDGKLYAGSVIGPGVYRIDVRTGSLEEVIGAPFGESDDVAMGPDGTLVWTALIAGELRARAPDGRIVTLLADTPMLNPVNFTKDGRLWTGTFGKPDALIQVDPAGKAPPRTVAADLGGINAFVDDGTGMGLYVPLAEKGAIGRVDLATGALKIIATDLGQPVAVKRDSRGGLVTLDWSTGKVSHVNAESGETQRIAMITPPLDNLAIGPDDMIYVSRPSDNSIIAVHPNTGEQRIIVQGALTTATGLALTTRHQKPVLILSDAYAYRFADLATGKIEMLPFTLGSSASSAVAVTDKTIVLSNARRPTVSIVERATDRALQTLSGFKAPMGVVAEDTGEIYVADYGSGEILKLMPGASPDRGAVAAGLQGPVGLARDGQSLIVSEATAGIVARIDMATGEKQILAKDLSQPEGLALLPSGKIAVAEVGRKRLIVIDPVTGSRVVVGDKLPIGQMFTRSPAPVYLPTGVAADETGAIYIACDADNSVLKFTPPSH
jgi:sugar lactone lactonase YvrE